MNGVYTIGEGQTHGPLVFHCTRVTWLHRTAGIGFVHFLYADHSGSTWLGRALAGPDGCEFFPLSTTARHDRVEPHFAGEAGRACIHYLAEQHHNENPR